MTVKNQNSHGEDQAVAVAFGRHVVTGRLLMSDSLGVAPNEIVRLLQAFGDGEWDSYEKMWFHGQEIAASKINFHPGKLASAADPADPFFPNALKYSGTTWASIELPPGFNDPASPEPSVGIFKTLKCYDFDAEGRQIAETFSANPARVLATLLIKFGKLPKERIDWQAWVAWRDYCDVNVTWTDTLPPVAPATEVTTVTRTAPQYEAHVFWSSPTTLEDCLNQILTICNAGYQDVNGVLRFSAYQTRTPSFRFTPANIVDGTFDFYRVDRRLQPNRLVGRFRDTFDPYLQDTGDYPVLVERIALQDLAGRVITGDVPPLHNMHRDQARRVLEFLLNLRTDWDSFYQFKGTAETLSVMPGDVVWLTHPVAQIIEKQCLVIEATDESAEESADERTFVLQEFMP